MEKARNADTTLQSQLQDLPEKIGVYLFKDFYEKVLYVGKALNVKKRVSSYFTDRSHLGPRTDNLLSLAVNIDYIAVDSEVEALLLEANLIKKHQPVFNTVSKDDTSFLYIKITKEDYPHVGISRLPKNKILRRAEEKKSYYYGPFPSAAIVRKTLKILRKMFPYCSSKKIPGKPCFYYGIGLCIGPCANAVGKEEYRKMTRRLRLFLGGNKKRLIRELSEEMKKASQIQNYEKAAVIRDMLEKLIFLTSSYHLPEAYLSDPDLLKKTHEEEISELVATLSEHFPNMKTLQRIETYDISNLMGKETTGSMVTFINGEADKSLYRKFRIKYTAHKPNDTSMMKEVVLRRVRHSEWDMPDLFLVDGGKGQVNAAMEALSLNSIKVPVAGLAKRNELLIIKNSDGDFKTLHISKKSSALKLLQRMRDESHRFAKSYHLKLRSNSYFDKRVKNG